MTVNAKGFWKINEPSLAIASKGPRLFHKQDQPQNHAGDGEIKAIVWHGLIKQQCFILKASSQ